MNAVIESATTYAVATVVLTTTLVLANAPTIMTVGGMVLLGLRLYVDGKRAYKTWSGE